MTVLEEHPELESYEVVNIYSIIEAQSVRQAGGLELSGKHVAHEYFSSEEAAKKAIEAMKREYIELRSWLKQNPKDPNMLYGETSLEGFSERMGHHVFFRIRKYEVQTSELTPEIGQLLTEPKGRSLPRGHLPGSPQVGTILI